MLTDEQIASIRRRFGLWLCRKLDWHKTPRCATREGVNLLSQCSRCGERICQDSQGNWFSLDYHRNHLENSRG